MQPFNHSQQLPFRYFDSDMAKKRPLVVSFRRIQKMTPSNFDHCNSVSICDIHRLDTKLRDNNEVMTMKIMSKYGSNAMRAMQKNVHCSDNQSCRNLQSYDKSKSLYDESAFERNHVDKGCVFPKEKFYGNAKLLLNVNDDILRKAIIDYDKDSHELDADSKMPKSQRNVSTNHLTKDKTGHKSRLTFKSDMKKRPNPTVTSSADTKMIDEAARYHQRDEMKNHFLSDDDDCRLRNFETAKSQSPSENETARKLSWKMSKSSSAPTVFQTKKLSVCMQRMENEKAFERAKHVSMLNVEKI